MSLRADIRLLRLAIERGLLAWEDLEAVPQPTNPDLAPHGVAWGPWISRLIEAGHLDESELAGLIRQLDPEGDDPLAAPDEPGAPVPDNWDRYQIFSRLGAGGMGSVFKAFDPQLNRFVALKFLHTKDFESAKAFLDEARAQAQVEHPLICQVYEVGAVEAQPYIAMRFIDGLPLDKAASGFPMLTKLQLTKQVADALQAAHQKGLIHRDVKPGNILVTTNQKGELRCVVVDFGLAKTLDRRTVTGEEVAGTPDYLSPEQLRGEPVDHRTDVYSLGAVLYELLAGRVPFHGSNIGQTLRLISEAEPEPPSAADPAIPKDLDAIVLKCLAKQPGARYSSAADLLADLERFVAGEPIQAHSAGVPYRAQKWLGRNRWLALVGAAALASLVVLGTLSLYNQRKARQRAELARRFSEEVKEMEASMRYATLLPAHSMSGQRADLNAQIGALAGEMERLGPMALGPGNFALGRAYFTLNRYEMAKQHLEQAWSAGYQGPEVAVALGQTIGRLYEEATYASTRPRSTAVAQATREELGRVFRDPALEYLRAGSSDSSALYLQGLIAFYEGRYSEAIEAGNGAWQARPWFYEARHLVGRVHEARGREALHAGDYDAALEHLATARQVYAELLDVARSDAGLQVSVCGVLNQRNEVQRSRSQLSLPEVEEALAACDAALAIDPESAAAHSLKARISWRWADVLGRGGEDPRPVLAEAIRFAETAIQVDPQNGAAHQNLAAAYRLAGNWEMLRGIDPVPALERSIEAAEAAIQSQPDVATAYNSLGNANILLARYSMSHGGQPEQHLDRAITSYERAIELNPDYTPSLLNLGGAWTTRADWDMSRGVDPTSSIERALAPLTRAIDINPNFLQLHNNLGNAHNTLAIARMARGEDPTGSIDAAVGSYRRALEINPDYAIGLYNLAYVERTRARYLIETDGDSTTSEETAEEAIRDAIRVNASDPENHMEHAELDLLRARRAVRQLTDPEPFVRSADAAIQRARDLNSDEPRLFYLEALGRRYLAEWSLAQGEPAAVDVSRGLQVADRAVAMNPQFSESIALQGVLLKLQSQILDGPRSVEVAQRGMEALQAAFEANPQLQRDHEVDLAELRRILGSG